MDSLSSVGTIVLTHLAFGVNGAIDSGEYSYIMPDDVREKIRNGTIFEFLEREVDVDVSLLVPEKRIELLEHWRSLSDVVDAERKFGVKKNGLCLILAYILQGIQGGTSL